MASLSFLQKNSIYLLLENTAPNKRNSAISQSKKKKEIVITTCVNTVFKKLINFLSIQF